MSSDAVEPRHWGWDRWALVALLLLGWALRVPPLLDNRFHADEALYAYWGLLIGRGQDPWLAAVPVDKPPLLSYLVAGAQSLLGNSEFAVRFPGLAAGWLTIGLTAALADALYRDRWAAMGAAVGVALSPFAILFSATAFTDPVMVALGLGTCVAAARGRRGWSGLLAGLAFATKQTGLAWVPLALALGQISKPKAQGSRPRIRTSSPQSLISDLQPLPRHSRLPLLIGHLSFVICHLPFVISLSLVVGLVFAWDSVRMVQGAESFWGMGVTAYGSLRPIWPQELWTRLWGWVGLARYFFVSPIVNAALVVGSTLLTWSAAVRRRCTRGALADLFLGAFLLLYFLIHWLFAFPVWDRYLLPAVPVLAVLLGRTLTFLASYLQPKASRTPSTIRHPSSAIRQSPIVNRHSPLSIRHWTSDIGHLSLVIGHLSFVICHLSFALLLLPPAWNAAHSRYPIGGDHGAYDGIDQVAAFLRELPEGAVVYHHWLGWHYADYLFDAPVYLAYWPTPAWLAQDVQAFGAREPRYVTFPSWESPARAARALSGVGYELSPALTTSRRDGTHSFTVCRIQPPSDP